MHEQTLDYEGVYRIAKCIGAKVPITSVLVEYLVGKGYDSDELAALGKKRAIRFIEWMSKGQGEGD